MERLNYTKQKRNDMITAGAYDGRFRCRVVKDKKKHNNKLVARKKVNVYEYNQSK